MSPRRLGDDNFGHRFCFVMMHYSPQAVELKPAPLKIPKYPEEDYGSPSRYGTHQSSRDDGFASPRFSAVKHRRASVHEQSARVIDAARKSLHRMSMALGPQNLRSPSMTPESLRREEENDSWKHVPDPPYHVLSKGAKFQIMALVCLASATTSLSYSTFSPAQTLIAKELHIKLTTLSVALSAHTIGSGVAPIIWGPLADNLGRRQTIILGLLIAILANLGLATVTNTIAALAGFRALQGIGSASIMAISTGILADIFPAADRGTYFGIAHGLGEVATTFGPVFGGYLAQNYGFHSIFYFLLFFEAVTNLLLFLFLPETHRPIAGNGSVKLLGLAYRPPAYDFKLIQEPECEPGQTTKTQPKQAPISWRTFVAPFQYLREKDILVTVLFVSITFMCIGLTGSLSSPLLARRYHLTPVQIGMVAIPSGITTIIAALVMGRTLDRNFQQEETLYRYTHNLPASFSINRETIPQDFPLEHARLQQLCWVLVPFVFFVFVFGVVMDQKSLFLFVAIHCAMEFATVGMAIMIRTLIIDLFPGKTASAIAVSSIVASGFSAVGSGVGQTLLEKLKSVRLFALLAGIIIAVTPLIWMEAKWGPRWRGQRADRQARLALTSPLGK
ncbi:MAG: hypothetical protein M1838_002239 [Thelocarpon superellum]|nr:MAG: hypothetical protein M1838_002239 [Thelocarpon superellum]